jgi:hypothetical protein
MRCISIGNWILPLALLAVFASGRDSYAETLIGLTTANQLVSFDSATPGTIAGPLSITGLSANEKLLDIDIRPATLQLYALGASGTIYTIDSTSGAATAQPMLMADPADATNPFGGLDAGSLEFGIDFNPVPDRLRVVGTTGQNLRINVGNGNTTTDGMLNGAGMSALSVAYTNPDTDPATGTQLYYIDAGAPGMLYTTSDPNAGVLTSVGSLGVPTNLNVGFDISGAGMAFASLTDPASGYSSLYTVNLGTGSATLAGMIGSSLTLNGLAAAPVPEPSTWLLAALGVLGLLFGGRGRHKFLAACPVAATPARRI